MSPIKSAEVMTGISITHLENEDYEDLKRRLGALPAVKSVAESTRVLGTDLYVAVIVAQSPAEVATILAFLANEGVEVPMLA